MRSGLRTNFAPANLIRINADGSRDETRVPITYPSIPFAPARQLRGRERQIIIAWNGTEPDNVHRVVCALNSDGSLDPSLLLGIWALRPTSCLQPDGKVLMSFYLGFVRRPVAFQRGRLLIPLLKHAHTHPFFSRRASPSSWSIGPSAPYPWARNTAVRAFRWTSLTWRWRLPPRETI